MQLEPRRTVAELCEATGLHANTVREHLQRLIDAGYVVSETERRTTRGRPRVLYSAATGAEASSPVAQRKARDAAVRGDLLRRMIPGTAPDGLTGEALHQLDALVEDLIEEGFDPLVDADALTIDLSPCAHAENQGRAVVCGVHLGVMQGVLAEAGGPLAVAGMEPACDPTTCVVVLERR